MKTIQFLGSDDANFNGAGGKSKNLHELKKAGIRVPDGFTLVMEKGFEATGSREEILSAIRSIGGYPVAVRSSALMEDLVGASFAGLYESFLNVSSDEELMVKIQQVSESSRGERVKSYLKTKGLDDQEPTVHVLIQKMVPAKYAGVYFTLHPNEGKEEEGYVEICSGLGENLVSGKVNPSHYRLAIESAKILEKTISDQGDGLTQVHATALRDAGLLIAALFGVPQDIEFAVDSDETLWILQARPITQIRWRSDVEEFTNADFKDGGVSASVCTPMMYSLYEAAMQKSMQAYFQSIKLLSRKSEQKTWIRSFYGRAYWNASEVKRQVFKIPGFREQEFDLDLGIQKDYGPQGPYVVPLTPATLIPVIPAAIAVEREYALQLERTENYFDRFYAPRRKALEESKSKLKLEEWVNEVLVFQAQVEVDYFLTIYNNTNLQSDFKKRMLKVGNQLGRAFDFTILYSGVEGISHLKAQQAFGALLRLAQTLGLNSNEFKQNFSRYLADFGFHADRELDLACPRWSEVPEVILHRMKELLQGGTLPESLLNPEKRAKEQHQHFVAEMEKWATLWSSKVKFFSARRWRAIEKDLERVRLYLRRREEMREGSTKAYALVRSALLELGAKWTHEGRLKNPEEIFYLTVSEVRSSSLMNEEMITKIKFRKLFLEGLRNLVPPNEMGFGIKGVQTTQWSTLSGEKTLKGLGCSPGTFEGTVRVITDLERAYELKRGEILVTRFTDPGWTTVLSLVGGVVTEVGGLLSHAAVIGRELGVPAILNLPQATELLKNGDQIRMDGSSGVIQLLPSVAPPKK